ncbi:alpha/beta hydrolase [Leisingera aquaemixtae]|uniref:Alpha/beta hydrolase n=1 Tax=Leisingera aquaemixtae TaxID=1396826 RepID=A0ABY5WF04_9RHOB|nr:alpha/beta hydrolase [Leisingera aquaemixtae]UWQ40050.1 alpha/beta hydrolase [Leisingera aquaemixtae]
MPASPQSGTLQVNGQQIAYTLRGDGPPLLLLHGFPQTKEMWEEAAPALARHFTVVTADLRGYGASSKPEGVDAMSFRNMAADQLALMRALGFPRFHLAGHDRGGRTAHRLALDAPEAVASVTVMDIIPTHLLLDQLTQKVARAYYHWFFLAQPAPLPERMIGADPQAYFESCLLGWGGASLSDFPASALAAYRRAWADPACVHAMCNDYRAAIDVDFHHDARDLDRKVHCPALVLYGADGAMAKAYDVAATWAPHLQDMTARSIPGGHFFIDSSARETAAALLEFLSPLPPL